MNSRNRLKESWIIGILGLLFFFFSNVTYTIPLATWLAPIFLIRFVRIQPKARGVVFLYFGIVLLSFIQWKGIIHAPPVLFYLISWLNTTILFIPFVLDRLLYKKLGNFTSTFVFPLSLVVIEFSTSAWGLHGTWGVACLYAALEYYSFAAAFDYRHLRDFFPYWMDWYYDQLALGKEISI